PISSHPEKRGPVSKRKACVLLATGPLLHFQQPACLRVPGRRRAVLAGGDAGQGYQMPPAEGRARGGEFLRHRLVVLLGVQLPILADRVLQEHVKDWARLVAEFAVTVDDGAYAALVLVPDSGFGIAEQRGGILRLDFLQLLRQRKALLCRGIAELVISRQDQASDSVARGADTGDVAPAIHRVGYVNAVRAAMTTAPWVEIYRVGGERDGL